MGSHKHKHSLKWTWGDKVTVLSCPLCFVCMFRHLCYHICSWNCSEFCVILLVAFKRTLYSELTLWDFHHSDRTLSSAIFGPSVVLKQLLVSTSYFNLQPNSFEFFYNVRFFSASDQNLAKEYTTQSWFKRHLFQKLHLLPILKDWSNKTEEKLRQEFFGWW